MSNTVEVCGYTGTYVAAGLAFKNGKRGKPRLTFKEWTKADGTPIRFRSAEHAERHFRTMGKGN